MMPKKVNMQNFFGQFLDCKANSTFHHLTWLGIIYIKQAGILINDKTFVIASIMYGHYVLGLGPM